MSRLLLLVVLAGCTVPPPPAPPPADPPAASPANEAALAALFGRSQVDAALAYARAYQSAETAADLRVVYDGALALERTLLGPASDGYDTWGALDRFREADLGLPGLDPTCIAECTEPAFTLDLGDWRRAAARVRDPGARAFFDALGMTYREATAIGGQIGGWPVFIEQTWDYGGHSRLGSGTHADLLAQLGGSAGGLYRVEIAALHAEVAEDALATTCVGPSAAAARAELVRIRDSFLLNRRQDEVEARVAAFARPAASGIEAGCATGGCACEGG